MTEFPNLDETERTATWDSLARIMLIAERSIWARLRYNPTHYSWNITYYTAIKNSPSVVVHLTTDLCEFYTQAAAFDHAARTVSRARRERGDRLEITRWNTWHSRRAGVGHG